MDPTSTPPFIHPHDPVPPAPLHTQDAIDDAFGMPDTEPPVAVEVPDDDGSAKATRDFLGHVFSFLKLPDWGVSYLHRRETPNARKEAAQRFPTFYGNKAPKPSAAHPSADSRSSAHSSNSRPPSVDHHSAPSTSTRSLSSFPTYNRDLNVQPSNGEPVSSESVRSDQNCVPSRKRKLDDTNTLTKDEDVKTSHSQPKAPKLSSEQGNVLKEIPRNNGLLPMDFLGTPSSDARKSLSSFKIPKISASNISEQPGKNLSSGQRVENDSSSHESSSKTASSKDSSSTDSKSKTICSKDSSSIDSSSPASTSKDSSTNDSSDSNISKDITITLPDSETKASLSWEENFKMSILGHKDATKSKNSNGKEKGKNLSNGRRIVDSSSSDSSSPESTSKITSSKDSSTNDSSDSNVSKDITITLPDSETKASLSWEENFKMSILGHKDATKSKSSNGKEKGKKCSSDQTIVVSSSSDSSSPESSSNITSSKDSSESKVSQERIITLSDSDSKASLPSVVDFKMSIPSHKDANKSKNANGKEKAANNVSANGQTSTISSKKSKKEISTSKSSKPKTDTLIDNKINPKKSDLAADPTKEPESSMKSVPSVEKDTKQTKHNDSTPNNIKHKSKSEAPQDMQSKKIPSKEKAHAHHSSREKHSDKNSTAKKDGNSSQSHSKKDSSLCKDKKSKTDTPEQKRVDKNSHQHVDLTVPQQTVEKSQGKTEERVSKKDSSQTSHSRKFSDAKRKRDPSQEKSSENVSVKDIKRPRHEQVLPNDTASSKTLPSQTLQYQIDTKNKQSGPEKSHTDRASEKDIKSKKLSSHDKHNANNDVNEKKEKSTAIPSDKTRRANGDLQQQARDNKTPDVGGSKANHTSSTTSLTSAIDCLIMKDAKTDSFSDDSDSSSDDDSDNSSGSSSSSDDSYSSDSSSTDSDGSVAPKSSKTVKKSVPKITAIIPQRVIRTLSDSSSDEDSNDTSPSQHQLGGHTTLDTGSNGNSRDSLSSVANRPCWKRTFPESDTSEASICSKTWKKSFAFFPFPRKPFRSVLSESSSEDDSD